MMNVLHYMQWLLICISWHFNNDSGRVDFIIIIEFKDLPRLKRDRNSVLFFLMIEKTLSSPALLCGMTRTDTAISENIGKMVFRKPQTTSIRKDRLQL